MAQLYEYQFMEPAASPATEVHPTQLFPDQEGPFTQNQTLAVLGKVLLPVFLTCAQRVDV